MFPILDNPVFPILVDLVVQILDNPVFAILDNPVFPIFDYHTFAILDIPIFPISDNHVFQIFEISVFLILDNHVFPILGIPSRALIQGHGASYILRLMSIVTKLVYDTSVQGVSMLAGCGRTGMHIGERLRSCNVCGVRMPSATSEFHPTNTRMQMVVRVLLVVGVKHAELCAFVMLSRFCSQLQQRIEG